MTRLCLSLCVVLISACAHTPPECQGKFTPLNPVPSTQQSESNDGPHS